MIHISNLNKTFGSSKGLSHINLHVAPGEMVALIGSSGSGKSTLMRHICGLTAADKGESLVWVDNEIVQKNGCISRDIRRIRAGIGMIFQQFNLVERMSVARNVMQTLRDLNQKDGLTVVVTLHQVDYAMRFCPRTVALKKGEIVYDGPTERLTPQFLAELYGAESDELFAAKTSAAQEAVTLPGSPVRETSRAA